MAAAESKQEKPDDKAFVEIRKWFFVKLPVRDMMRQKADWLRQLHPDDQKKLLDLTVRSDICKKFPVSFDYQQKFVKTLIQLLEDNGTEVEGTLYETYTTLISAGSVNQEINYKTFVLPDGEKLIIEESINMLSHGTTGLQIWPAAFWLAEWILENKEEFRNKCVLELGCGLGFTGLVTMMSCGVKEYIFTDWHIKVLQSLFNNLCLNLRLSKCNSCTMCGECFHKASKSGSENWGRACTWMKRTRKDKTENGIISSHSENEVKSSSSRKEESAVKVNGCSQESTNNEGSSYFKMSTSVLDDSDETAGDCHRTKDQTALDREKTWDKFGNSKTNKSSRIHFASLDWEEENSEIKGSVSPNILVAADVIFDPKMIGPFVATLKAFVTKTIGLVVIYVASAVRNQQTFDQFVKEIGATNFVLQEIPGPSSEVFVYDRSCPMKLLKLTAKFIDVKQTECQDKKLR